MIAIPESTLFTSPIKKQVYLIDGPLKGIANLILRSKYDHNHTIEHASFKTEIHPHQI